MTVVSTIQALYSPIYNSLYAYMVARKMALAVQNGWYMLA